MTADLLAQLLPLFMKGMKQEGGVVGPNGPVLGVAPDGGPIELPPTDELGLPLPPVGRPRTQYETGLLPPVDQGQGTPGIQNAPEPMGQTQMQQPMRSGSQPVNFGGAVQDGLGALGAGLMQLLSGGKAGATSSQGDQIGESLSRQQAGISAPMASQQGGNTPFLPASPMMGAAAPTPLLKSNSEGSTSPSPAWGDLFNLRGTASEPNALVRMGVGYNQGGLLGSLGYLLTDMSRRGNRPPQQ